ncbi:hypothetical protein BXZ70DRAFT_908230 [Cristinia sonorae]|uniref:Uncharacterized protein n=1 Tax=Cristinia sonorae TaxID=1940300 RepID=A0A8K0UMY5_9AGAR|nr:hypothetical protein BXZ70DRAFT_908230 [Cristinia sonorae]
MSRRLETTAKCGTQCDVGGGEGRVEGDLREFIRVPSQEELVGVMKRGLELAERNPERERESNEAAVWEAWWLKVVMPAVPGGRTTAVQTELEGGGTADDGGEEKRPSELERLCDAKKRTYQKRKGYRRAREKRALGRREESEKRRRWRKSGGRGLLMTVLRREMKDASELEKKEGLPRGAGKEGAWAAGTVGKEEEVAGSGRKNGRGWHGSALGGRRGWQGGGKEVAADGGWSGMVRPRVADSSEGEWQRVAGEWPGIRPGEKWFLSQPLRAAPILRKDESGSDRTIANTGWLQIQLPVILTHPPHPAHIYW